MNSLEYLWCCVDRMLWFVKQDVMVKFVAWNVAIMIMNNG